MYQRKGIGQSKLIASLLNQRAYPHPVSRIELLETHISWVILTGAFAYKIKKPVKLEFLDFSTLAQRRYFCEQELTLNRRWAPELYLAVVPICGREESPSIGGHGEAIEYALKMVQFPQEARLDNQLETGMLCESDMQKLAETIAGQHGKAKKLSLATEEQAVQRVTVPMEKNYPPLVQHADKDTLQRVRNWTDEKLRELETFLSERQRCGFVRECHGDLHLANLVRLSSGIVAFDCVEFSSELRTIDVISDVAFLAMDLIARARQDLAYVFINRYLECTGDYSGMAVFGLYYVYHCMIRAKVAAIRKSERASAAGGQQDLEELAHYCDIALTWIERPPPTLIAMHGFSASGKTWLSRRLLSRLPAIRVRSDIERKRLFGIDETGSSGSAVGAGIYSDVTGAGVYEKLSELAESLLESGFTVIVDASFLRRGDRRLFEALAERTFVQLIFIDTTAGEDELARRLRRRKSGAARVSEADLPVLRYQHKIADRLHATELERTIFVATDKGIDLDEIVERIEVACEQ